MEPLSDSEKWLVLATVLICGWLLYLLAPVLTPFLTGAALAYLGDPLVDRLEARGLGRTGAVLVVFSLLFVSGLAAMLVLVPLLQEQIEVLIAKTPQLIAWIQHQVVPRLSAVPGLDADAINFQDLRQTMVDHWETVGSALRAVVANVFSSGQLVLGWLAYFTLIPVVTFYLLRDWDVLIERMHELIPRRIEPKVTELIAECDAVLAQFVRGQLLVMLALTVVYTSGLLLIGLDLAVLVGLTAGVFTVVPYLGTIIGIGAAGVAAFIQFQDVLHVAYVGAVFGVAQVIEGMVLAPILVGERIGLHPVAVIFAIMAGGQLFGFMGVLLALPVAAVVVVFLRHAHERYLQSRIYA